MKLGVLHNLPQVERILIAQGKAVRPAAREAMNRTVDWSETDLVREMRVVFDRPTRYTLKALFKRYASTSNLEAILWFKQRSADRDDLWARPQIFGGGRDVKPFELRLQRAGLLPSGWMVVPGGAMPLDAYGNPSRGELSRILNVLGAFTEAGYNKANAATTARLRKGNAKRGVYGFEYWVNKVGSKNHHIPPGIYRRVYTGFGQSLKPMLIFISRARYRARLDFYGIVSKAVDRRFEAEFTKAWQSLTATGSASAYRRGVAL
jgi:hypothetical protein